MKSKIRKMAVAILKDDPGICLAGYEALLDVLGASDAQDVERLILSVAGRFYLPEHVEVEWTEAAE